jgi:hypothetical protein
MHLLFGVALHAAVPVLQKRDLTPERTTRALCSWHPAFHNRGSER